MTRLLLIAALLGGCSAGRTTEEAIAHCHANGYWAATRHGSPVNCCSRVNGDDVCIHHADVTRHRRETGQ